MFFGNKYSLYIHLYIYTYLYLYVIEFIMNIYIYYVFTSFWFIIPSMRHAHLWSRTLPATAGPSITRKVTNWASKETFVRRGEASVWACRSWTYHFLDRNHELFFFDDQHLGGVLKKPFVNTIGSRMVINTHKWCVGKKNYHRFGLEE